ncbi:hypothetical protein FXN65_10605 [Metapseudomonas lalkuanensis]|uniref:Guanylate cyclase domain-containing protein n=1 Tax=Metapseudomonas lalkuanensis TaxID=2604832 RepID=A0A5J6QJ14_9GAMM|nr:hypothetical protein [Pseudomonas lalkuanensis]QEY62504.1 hypothetical protein FXN65_10605 [Pseudomonas lalkuanensis]
MEYEKRLVCFIDLLGFKSTIEKSADDSNFRARLYEVVDALGKGEIEEYIYGSIPILDKDGLKPAREKYSAAEIRERFHPMVRMEVTQFSDSFVFSVPAENDAACEMLVKAAFAVHMVFFLELDLLMRGGLTVGSLVHVKNGPLFGPAMNEAHAIESSEAIYPRVVVSEEAKSHLDKVLSGLDLEGAIKKGFDGRYFFDLIDILTWPANAIRSRRDLSDRLFRIEKDILSTEKRAHSKIAYLLHRWSQVEPEFS